MELITNKGNVVLVDPDIATLLNGRTLVETPSGTVTVRSPGSKQMETLGRVVLGLAPGDPRRVRHLNGDPHDCRRENLQTVSLEKSMSLRSRRASRAKAAERLSGQNINPAKTTSKYRGVTLVHPNGGEQVRYQSRITANGRTHSLGLFEHEDDAARAYDRARDEQGLAPVNFTGEQS